MVLNTDGFEARTVHSCEAGVELARSLEFEFLVSAVVMPQMNGIEAATQIRKLVPKCKVLLISGENDSSACFKMLCPGVTNSKYSPNRCSLENGQSSR